MRSRTEKLRAKKSVIDWKKVIATAWADAGSERHEDRFFPLVAQGFDHREIIAAVEVLLSGRLTMGTHVREFEAEFAKYIGANHSVMVNSGSSALLLAMAVLSNPARRNGLRPGDEVLVPAVCWPTSVWPIVQMGLTPVFVDVDPDTLNINLDDLRKKLTKKARALMAVHILGNAAPMKELLRIVAERELLLIEDTCESLGSRADREYLGAIGDFGCYSFYYSHHITTGEGGMVVCRSEDDYDLLKCLRAHGWSRELRNRDEIHARHRDVDSRFMFVNLGYNLRPMEIQAAFGKCQLQRLQGMNDARNENRNAVIAALKSHKNWKGQMNFAKGSRGIDPAWFGLACLLNGELAKSRQDYLDYLSAKGVENRPIVSGNFARQPAVQVAGIKCDPEAFPGADEIHRRGFFIGIHSRRLLPATVHKLADIMLGA